MIEIRRSSSRGIEKKEWLTSFYTFSFDGYVDSKFPGFRALRALNEDVLAPDKGYGEQYHEDLEMITYVVEGVVELRDSSGNTSLIREGEIHRLSAGTGISESKFNISHYQSVHLFQIWIEPLQHGIAPTTQQHIFSEAAKWGQWALLVSQTGRDGSVAIHQDMDLWASDLDEKDETLFEGLPDRFYWIQVVSGRFRLMDKETLEKGDGAKLTEVSTIHISCEEKGEILLFDL